MGSDEGTGEENQRNALEDFYEYPETLYPRGLHPFGGGRPTGCLQNGFKRLCIGRLLSRWEPSQPQALTVRRAICLALNDTMLFLYYVLPSCSILFCIFRAFIGWPSVLQSPVHIHIVLHPETSKKEK